MAHYRAVAALAIGLCYSVITGLAQMRQAVFASPAIPTVAEPAPVFKPLPTTARSV